MKNMIQQRFDKWQERVTDATLKAELKTLSKDEIANRFFDELSFGTAGLRGVIGVGSNCMNIYTVAKATQGIAEYFKGIKNASAVICYDSRINSELFARVTAQVFASNGIKVYISKELMPTPYTSFCVRELGSVTGVMITASHNPSIYNGYKLYNSAGCQMNDADSEAVSKLIDKVDEFDVKTDSFENYIKAGKICYISDELESKYMSQVKGLNVNKVQDIKVVYSALNGAGYKLVPQLLESYGISPILVAEQCVPDGNFTTCKYPNPEKQEALALGLEYCKKHNADILLATDPDADRIGVAVKSGSEYKLLTGNEVGVLLADYLLAQKSQDDAKNSIVIKSIVSSDLANKVAESYGSKLVNVLTGFKYIGEKIGELEKTGEDKNFVLAFEESYGYSAGSFVRDKDAIIGAGLIVEMASHYLSKGMTLVDKIKELYEKFGYYESHLYNYEFTGQQGFNKMASIMKNLRDNKLKTVLGSAVIGYIDYLNQSKLPKSNVLEYTLDSGVKFTIRPSGTEPKLKIYLFLSGSVEKNIADKKQFTEYFDKLING